MTCESSINQSKPLSKAGLHILQQSADDMTQEVTDGYFAKYPDCYKGDFDKIRAMCKTDLQHHLRFLFSAMVSASPEIFRDYACWLNNVLVSRNLSVEHPINSFELIKSAFISRLSGSDIAIAVAVLDSGINAIKNKFPYLAEEVVNDNQLSLAHNFNQALTTANRKQAEQLIAQSLQQGSNIVEVSVDIVQPAMYEIGRLWQTNRLSVAQEHMATAISQNALVKAFMQAEFEDPIGKKALFACVEGNHHCLGLRMISDAYETKGWDASFLGADTPTSSILSQVDQDKPDVLALSVSQPHQILALQEVLTAIRVEMSSQAPNIIVGGLTFNKYQSLGSNFKIDAWYPDAKKAYEDL